MKNIVALIGSPKPRKSSSGAIVDCISEISQIHITKYRTLDIFNAPGWNEAESDILNSDILLFVFPLYVDSLPATLLETMVRLEKTIQGSSGRLPKVYAICNCGFYDAEQTATALSIIENYCSKTSLSWQYGIGIGSGGIIAEQAANIKAHGPLANLFKTLTELCTDIFREDSVEKDNIFITPGIPRFLYHFAGNTSWKIASIKNHTKKSLRAKPHGITDNWPEH